MSGPGGAEGIVTVLLVVGPLLAAALLSGATAVRARWVPADLVTLASAIASLGASVWLYFEVGHGRTVVWLGGWQPRHHRSVGVALVADRAAVVMVVIAAGITVAALVYSWHFLADAGSTYHALVLVFLGSITGFVLAGDLFDAFVWFELMGVAAYALTGMRVEEPRSVHGALTFGIVNTLGGSMSLLGVAMLYARTGELNLAAVGQVLRGRPADALVLVACALLFSGVLVKAAAVPFHFWTADAEAVAPTPVCAMLSGAMVTVGVFAVARWWWVVFAGVIDPAVMRLTLLCFGAATAVVGAVMCATQRHIKRLLAYSTVSHVGVMLCGVGLLNPAGLAAAGVYALGHACVKAALFLATGVLLNRYETVDEHRLFGRARGRRVSAAVFVVGALGLAGLPAFATWLGKAALDEASVSGGEVWLLPILLLPGILTGGAVLRVAGRVFFGLGERPPHPGPSSSASESEEPEGLPGVRPSMSGPAAALLLVGLVSGAVPHVLSAAYSAAVTMTDTRGYVGAVLDLPSGRAPALAHASATWTLTAVVVGVLTALAALAFAAASWWPSRIPRWLCRSFGSGRVVVRGLHQVHRAHVGEYVSWVLVGVTALGGLLLLG